MCVGSKATWPWAAQPSSKQNLRGGAGTEQRVFQAGVGLCVLVGGAHGREHVVGCGDMCAGVWGAFMGDCVPVCAGVGTWDACAGLGVGVSSET